MPSGEMMRSVLILEMLESDASLTMWCSRTAPLRLRLALMRAMSNSVSGANVLRAPNQQMIELEMDQWDVKVGFSFSL